MRPSGRRHTPGLPYLVTVERRQESAELIGRFVTDRPVDDLPYCNPVESPRTEPAPASGPR
ncbi:hypothetical protein [Streptomyces flaveolus]|uniref:hypothetical protein n=1 Tax=Streptomyces flaveolus TaxID=67297 RepID=UPI0036AF8F69